MLWRVGELIDQNATLLAELESLNGGMIPLQAQRHVKVGSELFRYYAGWCTKIEGIARRRQHRRPDRHRLAHARLHPQRALRRGRADLPVERTGLQFLRQARAVAGGGLQQRRQTRRGDTTFGAGADADPDRGRSARRSGESGDRLRPHRWRRDHRTPRRREGRVHRLDRSGPGDRARLGATAT